MADAMIRRHKPLLRSGEIARTSPLRRTPLERTSRLNSSGPIKAKRPVVSRQERIARLLVKHRSGGLCELVLPGCTVWATDWCHRIARGRGGRWTASDGLAGCRSCHEATTNTNGRRAEYERAGYIVRTGGDTAAVPVLIGPQRHRVLLTDDGLYDHLPTISPLSDYQPKGHDVDENARHAAVVESLKTTASELHARAHEDMNDDWADRMADGLAAAGLHAVPAPTVDAIERTRQIIADHCFGPHVDSVAELRALEIAAACTDDMVDEGLLAASAAQPAPFTDLTARLAAADAGWGLASGDGPSNPDYIRFLAAQVEAFEGVASPAAPADDEAAPTMRTLHVTTTRDIPEGHTDQRVRYEYNGDSWEGWLIAAGSDAGEEIYIMRDNGERWVVMSDNVTLLDSTAALAALREGQ